MALSPIAAAVILYVYPICSCPLPYIILVRLSPIGPTPFRNDPHNKFSSSFPPPRTLSNFYTRPIRIFPILEESPFQLTCRPKPIKNLLHHFSHLRCVDLPRRPSRPCASPTPCHGAGAGAVSVWAFVTVHVCVNWNERVGTLRHEEEDERLGKSGVRTEFSGCAQSREGRSAGLVSLANST